MRKLSIAREVGQPFSTNEISVPVKGKEIKQAPGHLTESFQYCFSYLMNTEMGWEIQFPGFTDTWKTNQI